MTFKPLIFVILLGGCSEVEALSAQESAGNDWVPYVECAEPLPVFTLGENSNPTKEQQAALCACIWQDLGSGDRKISEKIVQGNESEVSEMQMRAFSTRFGAAVEKCGGMNL